MLIVIFPCLLTQPREKYITFISLTKPHSSDLWPNENRLNLVSKWAHIKRLQFDFLFEFRKQWVTNKKWLKFLYSDKLRWLVTHFTIYFWSSTSHISSIGQYLFGQNRMFWSDHLATNARTLINGVRDKSSKQVFERTSYHRIGNCSPWYYNYRRISKSVNCNTCIESLSHNYAPVNAIFFLSFPSQFFADRNKFLRVTHNQLTGRRWSTTHAEAQCSHSLKGFTTAVTEALRAWTAPIKS